jgi:hypothetical protein
MKNKIVFFVFLAISLTACASYEAAQTRQKLQTQIGRLSYDQALATWGQPLSVFQGDEVFITTWGSESSGVVAVPIGNMIYAGNVNHGWKLTATFNKNTRILAGIKYDQW